jgi:hypothetical protein
VNSAKAGVASLGDAKMDRFGGRGNRSRSESSSPITLPCASSSYACVSFWPTINALSLQRTRNRVNVALSNYRERT